MTIVSRIRAWIYELVWPSNVDKAVGGLDKAVAKLRAVASNNVNYMHAHNDVADRLRERATAHNRAAVERSVQADRAARVADRLAELVA